MTPRGGTIKLATKSPTVATMHEISATVVDVFTFFAIDLIVSLIFEIVATSVIDRYIY